MVEIVAGQEYVPAALVIQQVPDLAPQAQGRELQKLRFGQVQPGLRFGEWLLVIHPSSDRSYHVGVVNTGKRGSRLALV